MIPERSLSLRPPRYLHALLDEVDNLVRRIAPYADDPRREALLDDAALASVRLDGSRLEAVPDADAIARARNTMTEVRASSATWLDALARYAPDDADRDVGALEFAGARAAVAADDLAAALLAEPADALVELHRRLTDGLVPPADAGRARASDQAVQDGSVGRVVFRAVPPDEVGARLAALCRWLTSSGRVEHPLIASGVVHHDLLEVHPFESANGRLARAAARLVLRARGLDPGGLAAVELALMTDALGYYEEVVATVRRGDLVPWLERWAEAVAAGLRLAAARVDLDSPPPPSRARAFLAQRDQDGFTVADYREDVRVELPAALVDLRSLLDAGLVTRVPGTRGLRYTTRNSTSSVSS